jgi:hypothetical protein
MNIHLSIITMKTSISMYEMQRKPSGQLNVFLWVAILTFGRERSLALVVGFSVVESANQSLSVIFDMSVCIYQDLFQDYSRYSFSGRWHARQQRSACGDVSVNNEASVVTLSTSRSID